MRMLISIHHIIVDFDLIILWQNTLTAPGGATAGIQAVVEAAPSPVSHIYDLRSCQPCAIWISPSVSSSFILLEFQYMNNVLWLCILLGKQDDAASKGAHIQHF